MAGVLRAIPLPLRIAAVALLFLATYGLLGKASSSIFIIVAILLWALTLVVWMYDQGWLNPMARVPALSRFLGFMSNRAAITAQVAPSDVAPPPGELDDAERRRLYSSAQEALDALRGNDEARNLIYQRIIEPAAANPDNPFASNAPAMIVLLAGPPGIGKTTAAHAIAHLLAGVGAVKTAKIVTVRPTDLRGGEFGSAIQLARAKATAAKSGTLFIDDAGWLLGSPDTYAGQEPSGIDFGMTVVDVLGQAPGETVVIATMSEEDLGRLKEDTAHARWLGKLARREIVFDDLDDDALLEVLDLSLAAMHWRLQGDDAGPAARRLLADIRDRRGAAFNNADACRQTAEKLIEITSEVYPDVAERRVITREIIRRAEDEME